MCDEKMFLSYKLSGLIWQETKLFIDGNSILNLWHSYLRKSTLWPILDINMTMLQQETLSQASKLNLLFQHQFQGPLGQLLCQLKVDYGQMLNTQQQEEQKHLMKEGQIVPPSGLGPGQGSPIPYGFVPMPVDYETYCRWMSQFGPSGTHGNG